MWSHVFPLAAVVSIGLCVFCAIKCVFLAQNMPKWFWQLGLLLVELRTLTRPRGVKDEKGGNRMEGDGKLGGRKVEGRTCIVKSCIHCWSQWTSLVLSSSLILNLSLCRCPGCAHGHLQNICCKPGRPEFWPPGCSFLSVDNRDLMLYSALWYRYSTSVDLCCYEITAQLTIEL